MKPPLYESISAYRETTRDGLPAGRLRRRLGDRRKGLSKEAKLKASAARTLFDQQNTTTEELGKVLGVIAIQSIVT